MQTRNFDEAIDRFEEVMEALHDAYYLEDCKAEIDAAVEDLIATGRDLDSEIDELRDKTEELKETIGSIEKDKSDWGSHVTIKIESLAMQNRIKEFIQEIYPYHQDEGKVEFTNCL